MKIHLLLKCVRVSLGRPQGTSRGVGALGGSEHSLFFMPRVKTMPVWAALVIWWKFADFQGTRLGHRIFSGCPKLSLWGENETWHNVRGLLGCLTFLIATILLTVNGYNSHLKGNRVYSWLYGCDSISVALIWNCSKDGSLWCSRWIWTETQEATS